MQQRRHIHCLSSFVADGIPIPYPPLQHIRQKWGTAGRNARRCGGPAKAHTRKKDSPAHPSRAERGYGLYIVQCEKSFMNTLRLAAGFLNRKPAAGAPLPRAARGFRGRRGAGRIRLALHIRQPRLPFAILSNRKSAKGALPRRMAFIAQMKKNVSPVIA